MFDLIKSFFKVGVLGFGGGSAVAPLIKKEAVEKHGWISSEEFIDIVAIANSLPGPSMAQMAAAVGYRKRGVVGALVAATSIIMPMVLIFTFIMISLLKFVEVDVIMQVVKPVFVVISVSMILLARDFFKKTKKQLSPLVFALISFPIAITLILTSIHPSIFIIAMMAIVLIFVKEDKK